ncbi:hypothetical protein SAMN04488598_1523 [Halanaerobium congolense]|uniref:Uncharacterized protein n=1 Tax=Halanaerobium congolense TaxID=54121 RepID=A0A1I0CZ94_9FIRM|nr:hypothetical protein [Halanaerobium congolense]PTX17941.1 hypothetical protein C7953_2767 [Halanaerobium congolense]SDG14839.1 hypothetical protein SAMN04488598_1523 [Halanaerobium congolense]SET25102.1 hypothetical protein SAMN04515652_1503 [Halanaerobium congolense]SFP75090.1 hypothetical protein SAMN04488596_1512 [Halanaerobium congolense]
MEIKKISSIIITTFILALVFSIFVGAEEINKGEFYQGKFFVGFTELYFGENNLTGDIELIEDSDKFEKNVDMGRINFYLQGKIKGKYLITAWLDTEEESLDEIFKNLDERKQNTPFEKIDAEKYYPVYGDDSQVVSETNTAGKLYLKLESDELNAIWGNYKLNYENNKLINLSKNIYGANIDYDNRFAFNTYWYQPFSTQTRDELELTGGILYYLRQDDLIAGSENVKLELRDSSTNRVLESRNLKAGEDYEINYLQGRITLKSKHNIFDDQSLIDDQDGSDKYFMVVDYQYDYLSSDIDQNNYGLQTKYDLTDQLYLGANYIEESSEDSDKYKIYGLNLVYQNPESTEFRIDYAESENITAEKYFSDDGGITYRKINLNNDDQAQAWNLEYSKVLTAVDDLEFNTFYSNKEAGFNSGSQYLEKDKENYGLALIQEKERKENEFSYEKDISGENETDIYNLRFWRQQTEQRSYELELENKVKKEADKEDEKTLNAALGFDHQFDSGNKIYGSQQFTLDKSEEAERNNITTLGGEIKREKWRYSAEASAGDQENILLGAGYMLNQDSEIYTNYEREFGDDFSTETTFGANTAVSDKTTITAEHRIVDDEDENKQSNVIGLDYLASNNLTLSFDYTRSDVEKADSEDFKRDIVGGALTYTENNFRSSNRIEYRVDDKSEKFEQLVLKSNSRWKYNEEFNYLSEIEYSKEKEDGEDRFFEGTIGMAYRPINNTKLNYLFKYTYLDQKNYLNLDTGRELGDYAAEKSQILALDLIYDLNKKWQLTEKIAYKNSEVKLNSINDSWARSETYLWANKIDYALREDLNLFAEYRILENKLAADRRDGFLLGAYKGFNNNTKVGIGYNFTDFNDDLTNLSYEAKGWFINLIKAW